VDQRGGGEGDIISIPVITITTIHHIIIITKLCITVNTTITVEAFLRSLHLSGVDQRGSGKGDSGIKRITIVTQNISNKNTGEDSI